MKNVAKKVQPLCISLTVRCLDCGTQVTVQSLNRNHQACCRQCGGHRFKAVPLKKMSDTSVGGSKNTSSHELNEEQMEDFLAVKEMEVGVYQINLPRLLDDNRNPVLAAGAQDGIYVIRLPSRIMKQHNKSKKER